MKTRIVSIDPLDLDLGMIKEAARVIRNGGLVAFPTETVYGLGANALDPNAVKKIYIVKGRPSDNPFIVHIANKKSVFDLARKVPAISRELIDHFWPGPLTLVFWKKDLVPKETTGGLDSVAIRMPDNEIALALIRESEVPIAAPSANLSGKPSPTSAKHVIEDLNGKIEMIIDGGETRVGVESTVLDLTVDPPQLLRPGGVTVDEIEEVIGEISIHEQALGIIKAGEWEKVKSPGMKYRHYAPEAQLFLIESTSRDKVIERMNILIEEFRSRGKKIGVLVTRIPKKLEKVDVVISLGEDPRTIASNLFKSLREMDEKEVDVIIVEGVKDSGLGLAIMNRLRKAAYKLIQV